jgi:hypothetical protein
VDRPSVTTREQFIDYIQNVISDYNRAVDDWENRDIGSYLEALAAWLQDCRGHYEFMNVEVNVDEASWQLFADALMAAAFYE